MSPPSATDSDARAADCSSTCAPTCSRAMERLEQSAPDDCAKEMEEESGLRCSSFTLRNGEISGQKKEDG